jgi:phosphocarrier protein HPr
MTQARAEFVVINRLGLHARAAAKLCQLATSFPCEVTVAVSGQNANAKSVMGLLLLCGAPGTKLEVTADGEMAEACLKAIGDLIEARFGEEQ